MDEVFKIVPKVRELFFYIKKEMDEQIKLKVENVTPNYGFILFKLRQAEENHEDVYQKDLEFCIKVNKSTISEMLDNMEKNDLIKRVPSKLDSRKKIIVLTPRGREVDSKVSDTIKNYDKSLKEKLTQEELEQFFKIINKLQG